MNGRRPALDLHWDRVVLLLGAVAVPALLLAYFNRNSGFVWDDLKNFRQAQVDGLSLDYLAEPTSGHFAPGHRLGDWVIQSLFPMNFPVSQMILLAGFVLSVLLFHRILTEVFRPGHAAILLTLLYAASSAHVGVTQWWAAGLDRVPATILSFVAILAYLRFYRTQSWRWLALSVTAVPAGVLFFYIKPVLVPVYLLLMRVLLLEPDRPLRETVSSAWREWRVWVLYAVPTTLSLVIYVAHYPTELNDQPSVAVFLRYLNDLWFRVVAPGFFGVFIPQFNHSWAAAAAIVAVQIGLVTAVVWTVRNRPGAWRGWTFFGVTFLINALAIGLTRVGRFSARDIAYTVYFNLEIAYLLPLAVAFLVLTRRGRAPVLSPVGTASPVATATRFRWAAGAMAIYLALFASAAHQLNDDYVWTGAVARDYTDAAAAGLARLERSGQPFAVVDGRVPKSVVPQFLAPYNGHSEVLPLISGNVVFDPDGRQLFEVAGDGGLLAVTRRTGTAASFPELLQQGALTWLNAEERATTRGVCFSTGGKAGGVVVALPGTISGRLYTAIRYATGVPTRMSLGAEPLDRTLAATAFRHISLRAGTRQAGVFPLPQSAMRRLILVIDARSDVCFEHLEVGWLDG